MSESRFERIMFSRVPVWLVGLLGVLALLAMVAFGNIAIHAYKGGKKAGVLGDAAMALSTIPEFLQRFQNATDYLRISVPAHQGKAGFAFNYAAGSRPDAGYLLLTRYDGDDLRSYVELWDLNAQSKLYTWAPPVDEINAQSVDFESPEIDLIADQSLGRMILRHPVVMPDGSIVIKSRSPLSRVDACNRIMWINDDVLFHHATEQDSAGNFWLASKFEPPVVPMVDPENFKDDAITQVSPDGELLLQRSVAELLLKAGQPEMVYGTAAYLDDPVHLNDVQPVLADGPFWKKGDVFLSLRNTSTVMLYRPSTDQIIWQKRGPWSMQHDVDVLDDHRISVFDNHSYEYFRFPRVDGHSDVVIYDFATDTVSRPWADALAGLEFQTVTEGLQTVRPNGSLFVEEQNLGRILELDAKGGVNWEFVNRSKGDGYLYRVGWSRMLEPEQGAAIAKTLAGITCP